MLKRLIDILPLTEFCMRCGGQDITRVKRKISNGTYQVFDYCQECKRSAMKDYIPHVRAGDIDSMPIVQDYTLQTPPCARCGSTNGVEYHHFAPQHVFTDADHWPTAYLCINCHREWHNIIAKHYATCTQCQKLYRVYDA